MDIAETLRRCEEKLFESSVRKNAEIVASMLADEFQEFGSSGQVYSKDQIIAELQSESPRSITMQGFRAQLLSNEIALVTYRSRRIEHDGAAAESPTAEFLRSSIWVLRDNQWKVLFHQGTKAL
ncbi:MAG TPA: nuclear transport factor 2 family protein [Silvibacterium sp.]|nr:nuclear transport factor 2 family protein [Silvibacterium sp.]